MRRLLSVVHGPVFGGGLNQLVELREPLERRGFETMAIITSEQGNAADRLRDKDVSFVQMPLHRLRATANPRTQLAFAAGFAPEVRAIRRVIKEQGIEVVQAHGDTNPHAALAGHLEGKAVVWQLYDTRTPAGLRRATMPLVTRIADAITTWGDELARVHPGALSLGERQITVFPPVDSTEFRPDDARRDHGRTELKVPDDAFLVGAVGNRNPTKGYQWLIRAVADARETNPRIQARILGAQSPAHAAYERMLHNEVAAMELEAAVELIDPGSRVPELMPALDVLVVSSVPRSEGIPTVILEAMSCGLPVIATDVGAIREVVEDGVTGYLVPPETPQAIASKLVALAAEPELGRRLGATGRRRVLERYELNHCADRHAEAYEIAIAHRLSRPRKRG